VMRWRVRIEKEFPRELALCRDGSRAASNRARPPAGDAVEGVPPQGGVVRVFARPR